MDSALCPWVVGLLLLSGTGLPTDSPPSTPRAEDVRLRGKVITLSDALRAVQPGMHVDLEPIAKQVVLREDDEAIIPLLGDEASRALFLDERLRNRNVEIRGKRIPRVPYLQVITFKVEQDGRLQTPEYYCNICTISVRFPQICPCCQGPMELRMKPERH